MSNRYKQSSVLLRRKQDFAATVLLVCVIALGGILLTFTGVKIVDHLREARVGHTQAGS